jgi:hypothetical protein
MESWVLPVHQPSVADPMHVKLPPHGLFAVHAGDWTAVPWHLAQSALKPAALTLS